LTDTLLKVVISILVLTPCFWHSRIQAGDLASHLYNAWLAGEVRAGAAPGVEIAGQWSNVLFDWVLSALISSGGALAAERTAVSLTVLLFFWGAFAAVRAVTGRAPWVVTPCLGMLAYGLVFHMGFFNFYLSTAFCLWTLALLWRPSSLRLACAAPLAVLAILAHAMPVVWMGSLIGYVLIARKVPPGYKLLLFAGGLVGLVGLHFLLTTSFPARWSIDEVFTISGMLGLVGVEQVWLFGNKYLAIAVGLAVMWLWLILERMDSTTLSEDPVFHLWMLHLVAFIALPSALQLPSQAHVLAYIPQRISFFSALVLCMLIGALKTGRGKTRVMSALAALFFTFLWADTRALDRFEDLVTEAVHKTPQGSRVVASFFDSNSRMAPLLHVIDRPCIGHCFSYGNYEPATKQFRLRATGPNKVVASDMGVVKSIEDGHHVVSAAEAPLWEVIPCADDSVNLCVRELRAGERMRRTEVPVTPTVLSGL
jgi:hypothetical protein